MAIVVVMAAGCAAPNTTREAPLTVENSSEFGALLRGPATGKSVDAFTEKHSGDFVKVDGVVVGAYYEGRVEAWIDVRAGDASSAELSGPVFRASWVQYAGNFPENRAVYGFKKGDKVRVLARLGALDPYEDVVYILDGEAKGALTHR